LAWLGQNAAVSARRAILTAAVGAVVLAALVVVAEATRQWRDWGCAGSAPPTPCVEPAVWHWSDIDAVPVVLGAGAGALLGVGLLSLAIRERRRRRDYGEA
jgi:hypothetical protein